MATWTITNIFATCQHPTSNSHGQVSFNRILVWSSANPGRYVEGNNGSTCPITMDIPFAQVPNYHAPIEVIGTYAFPVAAQGQQFVVTGWLPSLTDPTTLLQRFQSDPMLVPVANTAGNVHVTGCTIGAPGVPFVSPMPFRWGGDFIWRISVGGAPPAAGIPAAIPTRLELCWARADAPNGPLDVPTPFQRTRVDLGSVYPINLFRFFLTDAFEYINIPNIGRIEVFGPWYVRRIMQTIWDWPQLGGGPRYDNIAGAAAYGVTGYGGHFQLNEWLQRVHATCNCYDLAAIVQLGCAILVDQNGQELLNSNWILQQPSGYINPGPLYGRLTEINCNSPFWARHATPPHVPWNDPRRTSFARHAWVEVSFGTLDRWVLDTTHVTNPHPLPVNYQPVPESGTRSRGDYIASSLDQRKDHGNAETKDGPDEMGADCFQNPNYRLQRIGVLTAGPNVMDQPPLPDALQDEIAQAIELGRNPNPPVAARNAALVNPDALIPLLTQGHIPLTHNSTILSLSSGATRQVLSFNPSSSVSGPSALIAEPGSVAFLGAGPITGTQGVSILDPEPEPEQVTEPQPNIDSVVLTLEVFTTPDASMQALIRYLISFTASPLSDIIQPTTPALGTISFQTASTVFWIRGDVFLRLTTSNTANEQIALPALLSLASQLDQKLAASTSSVSDPGPNIVFVTHPPETLKTHAQLTVKTSAKTRLVDGCVAVSDDTTVVLPAGPGSGGEFVFFTREEGDTTVTILVADFNTLRPGSLVFDVSVVE